MKQHVISCVVESIIALLMLIFFGPKFVDSIFMVLTIVVFFMLLFFIGVHVGFFVHCGDYDIVCLSFNQFYKFYSMAPDRYRCGDCAMYATYRSHKCEWNIATDTFIAFKSVPDYIKFWLFLASFKNKETVKIANRKLQKQLDYCESVRIDIDNFQKPIAKQINNIICIYKEENNEQ